MTLLCGLLLPSDFSRLGVTTADNLHFYNIAFLFLRSDALPATNPLFGGKTTADFALQSMLTKPASST